MRWTPYGKENQRDRTDRSSFPSRHFGREKRYAKRLDFATPDVLHKASLLVLPDVIVKHTFQTDTAIDDHGRGTFVSSRQRRSRSRDMH
jgi:hypothetical protein